MPQGVLWVLSTLVTLGILFWWLPRGGNQRRRRRLRRQFGQPPEKRRGLTVAEAFLIAQTKADPVPTTIDDITWNDLDGDDVFYSINNCQSATGDVALYTALRRPLAQEGEVRAMLARRRQLMALFEDNEKLRTEVQFRLSHLGRLDAEGMEMTVFRPSAFGLRLRWLFIPLAFCPCWSSLCFGCTCPSPSWHWFLPSR